MNKKKQSTILKQNQYEFLEYVSDLFIVSINSLQQRQQMA